MKKAVKVILLVMGMVLYFTGCGETASDSMAEIYYDQEKLGSYYSSYKMAEAAEEQSGNQMTGTYRGLNGMVLLWNYEPDTDVALDVSYNLHVTKGKVKLIMVGSDGTIVTIAELSGGVTSDVLKTQSFSLHDGLYCLKLVGTEEAVVDFQVQINEGSFIGTN